MQHPSDKLLTAAAQTAWRIEIVHSQWLKSCYAHKQLVPTSEFRIDAAAVLASQDTSQAEQSATAQRAPLRTLPGNFATDDALPASVAYSQGAGAAADTLVKLSRDAAAPAAGTDGDLQRSRDGSGSELDGSPHILIPDTEPHAGDACEESPLMSTSGRSGSQGAQPAAVQACARAGTSGRLAMIQEEEDAEAADCAAAAIPVLGILQHRKKRRSTEVRKSLRQDWPGAIDELHTRTIHVMRHVDVSDGINVPYASMTTCLVLRVAGCNACAATAMRMGRQPAAHHA